MKLQTVSLSAIRLRDAWDVAWPPRPEIFAGLEQRLPGWPLLVVDGAGKLIFARDYLPLLRGRGVSRAEAFAAAVGPGEALLLGLQLRRAFCGLTLGEELEWVRRLAGHMAPAEIQRRAGPCFTVDGELLALLPALTTREFRPALSSGALGLRAARRLPAFAAADRRSLLALFCAVHCSESHQQIVIDLVEEIGFARRLGAAAILRRIGLAELLAARAGARAVVDALSALRYPHTTALEAEWQRRRRAVELPAGARLSHAPFFEQPGLELNLRLTGWEELERLLAALKRGAES